MSVHYTGGGGNGLLGSLLGSAAMFTPGLQGVAPYLMGARALMNGDVGEAAGTIAGGVLVPKIMDSVKTANDLKAANQDSLFGALTNVNQGTQQTNPWSKYIYDPDRTMWNRQWR
jgi:hypothetical protein